jgi:hypothetical protein
MKEYRKNNAEKLNAYHRERNAKIREEKRKKIIATGFTNV